MKALVQRLALFAATTVLVSGALAQERKADDDSDRVEVRIEDGRVWVNGEEVPEGVDLQDYLRERGMDDVNISIDGSIRVDTDKDGEWRIRIDRDGDDAFGPGNVFVFRNKDDGNRAFGYNFGGENAFFRNRDGVFGLGNVDFNLDMDGLAHVGPGEILGFMSSSPEIMRKERESRTLARRVREASGAEREELERELDALLAEIFDAKLDTRRERISQLEERLSEQREALRERESGRNEIIARRKAELLGEPDRFDW